MCYKVRLDSDCAPIVYRLGHQVFILKSGVRLPVGVPIVRAARSIIVFPCGAIHHAKYSVASGQVHNEKPDSRR